MVESNLVTAEYIQAIRGKDYLLVHTTVRKYFNVNLEKISGAKVNGYWYNPRNGETKNPAFVNNISQQIFKAPSSV